MVPPKISVIIPSFNKAEYISQTFDSIFRQNYKHFEVIVQDGGSNDGTVEIIKRYAKLYPKHLIWESKKDNGQVDAINKGMKKATGDILTYINADDTYFAGAFEKVSKYFSKNGEVLWVAGYGRVINRKGKEIGKFSAFYKEILTKLNYYPLLLTVNYLMQPSVFFSREAFQKYGPFEGTNEYVLEYDFWLKLGKVQMPKILPATLSSFRLSGENISSMAYNRLLDSDFNLVKKYTNNPLILIMHKINNLGRVVTIHILK